MTAFMVSVDIPKQYIEVDAESADEALAEATRELLSRGDTVFADATWEVRRDEF